MRRVMLVLAVVALAVGGFGAGFYVGGHADDGPTIEPATNVGDHVDGSTIEPASKSKSKSVLVVPDVVRLPVASATRVLTEVGLVVEVVEIPGGNERGTLRVASQLPLAGTRVPFGTSVAVYVS